MNSRAAWGARALTYDVDVRGEPPHRHAAEPVRLLDGGVRTDCWAGFAYLSWVPPSVLIEGPTGDEARAGLTLGGLDRARAQGLDTVLQITLETEPRVLNVAAMPPGPPGHELCGIHVVALQMIRVEAEQDHRVVDRLLQLHYHELGLHARYDIDDAGLYRAPQRTAGSIRWLFRDDQWLIGFAIVCGSEPATLAEFFVLPRHRRQGIGRGVARALFSKHPGSWRLYVDNGNRGGLAFWGPL